jgi:cytochrome c5
VSKQDNQFFNVLSVVMGGLVAVAIVLFGIARSIGTPFEAARAATDSVATAKVAENTAPIGRIAVAGRDNARLAISAPGSGGAPAVLAVPKSGEETFQTVCAACHGTGVGGAPKVGDHAAWGPRIGQGKPALYEHALKGFTGKSGVMLAKGGRGDLPDALVTETVDYMVKQSQ